MSTELLNISNVGAAAILKTPSCVIHDVTWLVTVSEGWLCGHCGKSPSHSHIPPERGEGLGVGMEWQPCCLVSLLIDMHQMLACLPRHFQSSLTLNNQTFLTFGCLQTENVACSRDHDELLKCPLGRMPTIFPEMLLSLGLLSIHRKSKLPVCFPTHSPTCHVSTQHR